MDAQLSDYLLQVHQASNTLPANEFQYQTLTGLRRFVDFDVAIWGTGDGSRRELHSAFVLDLSEALLEGQAEGFDSRGVANLAIAGKTWDLCPTPGMAESRTYCERSGLHRVRQMASTIQFDTETGLHVFVTLARDQESRRFTDAEMKFKSLLTPHLFMAARHNDMNLIKQSATPMAIVDRFGLLHAQTPNFTEITVSEWGQSVAKSLPEAVCERLWRKGRYRSQQLRLEAEAIGDRYLVRARAVGEMPLSEREFEIAWAFANGQSYKEVARILDIAPTTVRSHLAHVYSKLGIRDKGSLALWLCEFG